jgi:3-oxoacyl-[acyl-carrier protein] reductase
VSPLVAWLASPAAAQVSGYVLVVYGKAITVVSKPTLGPNFESADAWTVESVASTLGPWFAEKRPITDGFTVIP